MKIARATDKSTGTGSAEWFTGDVYVDSISMEGDGLSAATVHFTPGARTAWHTHPTGQTIHIIEGIGWVQREGEDIIEVRPGDTVFFEPGENHWHGASANRFMAHIAIVRISEDGQVVAWGKHVADDEYSGPMANGK